MRIRWFRTYDEFGVKSDLELQIWDHFYGRWESIEFVECKESEEEGYLTNVGRCTNVE